MSLELDDRLERAADALPRPSAVSRERARSAALAALGGGSRRRARRFLLAIPAAAVAVAVGVIVIVAAPWHDGPLATERALAALGPQPVIHAIVEQPTSRETVIDLSSGEERVEASHWEYWYDDERDTLRVRLSIGGRLLPGGEFVQTPEGFFTDRGVDRHTSPPQLDPALAGFASGYREALASGEATVVGEDVIDGRKAVILRFFLALRPSGEEVFEEVAVAADDYRPLRFRFASTAAGGEARSWSEAPRVVEIETIARDPRDFEKPRAEKARPAGQAGVDERTLEPAEAASAFGQPVLWPGRAVAGVELAQIELMRLTTRWTDGHVSEGHALVFQYGASLRDAHLRGKPSLIITEGTSPEETPRFAFGGPLPEPGQLRLRGTGKTVGGDAEMWFGTMQRDGVYVSFQSPQRDLVIAAARAMMPLD